MEKLDSLMQTVEMARCTGIPFDWVLQRGIMVRNSSLLLRRARPRGYIFPCLHAGGGVVLKKKFEGATVLDAMCGIHANVGVLDFSSMYPSIIRAHNLCYSTIILGSAAPEDHEIIQTKPGVTTRFVKEGVVKGLLPEVVEHLQTCRAKAKVAYAAATDPMQKRLCKARELAFKVAGNGMYGALGSEQSLLPLMAIAETVTAIGRRDIKCVKQMAETLFPDAVVVYGDTDSVFVRFSVSEEARMSVLESVHEASNKARVLAVAVNGVMAPPKRIEFEKVYSTMLLLSKKRYAGVMYADGFKWGTDAAPIDIKGMQCARRDGCPLVRNLVKECLVSILQTGDVVDAAAIVRQKLLQIVRDEVPLDDYAIQKVLRKTIQDCCLPMTPSELCHIRRQIASDKPEGEQLSYAEQDEAIRHGVRLPWRTRVTLPHVMLAWRLRQQDPGNAPVLGESLRYVVTLNGGKQLWEKVESVEHVRSCHVQVDRQYYLDALRVPLDNIFYPICLQRHPVEAREMATRMLWECVRNLPLRTSAAKRRACVDASPIAMAFKRQASRLAP
jgi:DNA polymerase delta subunit 1